MKIAVCVDGSVTSEKAFQWYCKEFHQPSNKVSLLHVCDEPRLPNLAYYEKEIFPQEEFENLVQKSKAKVDKLRTKFHELAKANKIDCQFIVLREDGGSPGEALVKSLTQNPVDTVIIGTRGLGKLRRTILGSVSNYLVHHSRNPVLVYRE